MSELELTMMNVRKAYRLLALYQERIFKMTQDIAQNFNYEFYRYMSNSRNYMEDNPTELPVSSPGWWMLPMYDMSFLYLNANNNANKPQPGEWLLDIYIYSDNGYQEDTDNNIVTPLKFDDTVEESDTEIGLYAIYIKKKQENYTWYDIHMDIEYPRAGAKVRNDPYQKIVGKSYKATKLLENPESLKNVLDNFKTLLAQNDIPV